MDSDPHSVTRAGNMLRSVVLDVPPADSLSCNSGALSSREQPGTHRREQEVGRSHFIVGTLAYDATRTQATDHACSQT